MKVKEVLTEGMIKLPPRLWDKLEGELLSVLYSYMKAKLERALRLTQNGTGLRLFKQEFEKHFGKAKEQNLSLQQKSYSRTIGKLAKADLPEYANLFDDSRFQMAFDDQGRPLRLVWSFDNKKMAAIGNRATFDASSNKMEMNFKKVKTIPWDTYASAFEDIDSHDASERRNAARSIKMILDRMVDEVEEVIYTAKHEMTHFIQYQVLARGSKKQVSGIEQAGKKDVRNDPEYYTSDVEFHPQIISAVGLFMKNYRELVRETKQKSLDWKPYAQFATGAISAKEMWKQLKLEDHVERLAEPYKFFQALKTKAPDKWKKAAKLFMQEVEKKFK